MRPPAWLTFVVAAAAMAVVGFALLGPGAAHPQSAARVWGGPWTGTRVLALRAVLVEKMGGIQEFPAGRRLTVSARVPGGQVATATLTTGPDGAGDVQLPFEQPISGDVWVSVTDSRERRLANGYLLKPQKPWGAEPRSCELLGKRSGDLHIRAAAAQGVFAAPFPGTLVIAVTHDGQPIEGARVRVDAPGAEPNPAHPKPTDTAGLTHVRLAPMDHDVELAITAESDRLRTGRWTGLLPVVPGAIWLDASSFGSDLPELRIVSPVPRAVAYLTIASETTRLWGGTVPLTSGPTGIAEGTWQWPLGPAHRSSSETSQNIWVVVSSEPYETNNGTVGWPVSVNKEFTPQAFGESAALEKHLDHQCQERRFSDLLLLDGQPQAEAREAARRARARTLVVGALGSAALLEALLLWAQFRLGSEGLSRLAAVAPKRVGAREASTSFGSRRLGGLIVALVMLVLAFAAIGLVVFSKLGG